jgi:hypothetical protein
MTSPISDNVSRDHWINVPEGHDVRIRRNARFPVNRPAKVRRKLEIHLRSKIIALSAFNRFHHKTASFRSRPA